MSDLDRLRAELRALRSELEPHQVEVERLLGRRAEIVDEARQAGMTWEEAARLCGVSHVALISAKKSAERRAQNHS